MREVAGRPEPATTSATVLDQSTRRATERLLRIRDEMRARYVLDRHLSVLTPAEVAAALEAER